MLVKQSCAVDMLWIRARQLSVILCSAIEHRQASASWGTMLAI